VTSSIGDSPAAVNLTAWGKAIGRSRIRQMRPYFLERFLGWMVSTSRQIASACSFRTNQS
jgi:hypothetical protein